MSIDNDLEQLEHSIGELRRLYDNYFMGIDRVAPIKAHERLAATVRLLATQQINNTALKFKRNTLVARFNTMQTRWNRIMRQIEDGTFKRDLRRAQKLHQGVAEPMPATPPPPNESAAATPPQHNPWQAVYQNYIKARNACGQNANVSYQALVATLSKQAQALQAKYNCKGVAFKVMVQDGKAIIKALPRN